MPIATNKTTVETTAAGAVLTGTHRIEGLLVANSQASPIDLILGDSDGARSFHVVVDANKTEFLRARFLVDRGLYIIAPAPGAGTYVTAFHGGDGA